MWFEYPSVGAKAREKQTIQVPTHLRYQRQQADIMISRLQQGGPINSGESGNFGIWRPSER